MTKKKLNNLNNFRVLPPLKKNSWDLSGLTLFFLIYQRENHSFSIKKMFSRINHTYESIIEHNRLIGAFSITFQSSRSILRAFGLIYPFLEYFLKEKMGKKPLKNLKQGSKVKILIFLFIWSVFQYLSAISHVPNFSSIFSLK